MRRFFADVESMEPGQTVTLGRHESHHLATVLRLRQGDEVVLFNNSGRQYRGEIADPAAHGATVRILGEERIVVEAERRVILCPALTKHAVMHLILEKAVELGAAEIRPFFSKRTVIRFKEETSRLLRWRKIILSATKQCGRGRLAEIHTPVCFEAMTDSLPADALKILLWEKSRGQLLSTFLRDNVPVAATEPIVLAIGPEGGFEEDEVQHALKHGFRLVSCGKRILRSETAALAALALVMAHTGEL
jgi:16S rRNA (uracil1498-N3)-methyltransferase